MIKNIVQHNKHIKAIKKEVYEKEILKNLRDNFFLSVKNDVDILFINLNKFHLFGENSFDRNNFFYKDLLYNQLLNELDLNYHHKYLTREIISIKGQVPKDNKAAIYCSFHFGSYVHVTTALRMLNKNFSVVSRKTTGSNIIKWEKDEHDDSNDYFHHSKTIDPEALDSSFQIFNTLKRGRSILLYIDVFSSKSELNSKRNKEFNIMNSKFFITSGIPEISKKINIPLVPVVCERTPDHKLEINFYDAVCNGDTTTENYAKKSFQECFDVFSRHLEKYPAQWDQWQFIHNNLIETPKNNPKGMSFIKRIKRFFIHKKKISVKSIITFNEKDFQIFQQEGDDYLLNINNYKCFKITPQLSIILQRLNRNKFTLQEVREFLNPTLYSDLVSQKVIVARQNIN